MKDFIILNQVVAEKVNFHMHYICLFGALRRINPCGSLASDGIKLNMMWMERVKVCKIKYKE